MANLNTHFIAWIPGTDKVKLVAWPEQPGESRGWSTWGACNSDVRGKPFKYRKMMVSSMRFT